MDLRFGTRYEELRGELRAFLAENWNAEEQDGGPDLRRKEVAFRKCAIQRGYLARGVPRKYGGSEQPPDPFR
ncbi:MAG: acyl-CoA/acyl-ACP dehydrogenase, partial [Deltaproteobacteria bacterium]|nr:acyl-CoA/acyl-ACP dehydrogenase [Deltaproteobacteria bacterium]